MAKQDSKWKYFKHNKVDLVVFFNETQLFHKSDCSEYNLKWVFRYCLCCIQLCANWNFALGRAWVSGCDGYRLL